MKRWTQRSERDERAASIRAIPQRALPNGPARDALQTLARGGAECYAYTPVRAEWTICIAPAWPGWEPRMTCAEWQAVYALATEWSRTPEPVTPESEWTALENATITAARHLLADGRETPGMRTERTMQLERTLSYLRWLLILASGADEGERRYDACRARAGQQCGGGQTV